MSNESTNKSADRVEIQYGGPRNGFTKIMISKANYCINTVMNRLILIMQIFLRLKKTTT